MRQWHCFVGGKQYGPLGEDVLRSWVAEGRVRPTDLVWTEGMAQWAPAASIPDLTTTLTGLTMSMSGVATPGGTGGQTANRELMVQARERLRGRWRDAVPLALLYLLATAALNMIPYVGACWSIVMLIIGGALELGMVCYFLATARAGRCDTGFLFRGFQNFGNALGAYLLRAIFMGGLMVAAALPGAIIGVIAGVSTHNWIVGLITGGILGFIPMMVVGVYVGLGYALTFFLLADNPALGPIEPIFQSWRIMRGHKARLFCLWLRFIGWLILSYLSCCIGFLWLLPYYQVSMARFYDDLRAPAAMAAQPAAPTPAPESQQVGTPPAAQAL